MTNLGTVRFLLFLQYTPPLKAKTLHCQIVLNRQEHLAVGMHKSIRTYFYMHVNHLQELGLMKSRQGGFSLIELLVVVAIILIIATIAIPSFLRAKMSANESSAVSSVHAVDTAEIGYASTFVYIGYSASLSDLGPGTSINTCPGTSTASCFIDPLLASGTKSGYIFTYVQNGSVTPSIQFTINADPQISNITGQRGFYSDESNIIRYNSTGPANSSSPPL